MKTDRDLHLQTGLLVICRENGGKKKIRKTRFCRFDRNAETETLFSPLWGSVPRDVIVNKNASDNFSAGTTWG